MNPALDPVCLQSQVHIAYSTIVHIVLVKDIIETLIEVLQVEKDYRTPSLHANLDLIDVTANLERRIVFTNRTEHM